MECGQIEIRRGQGQSFCPARLPPGLDCQGFVLKTVSVAIPLALVASVWAAHGASLKIADLKCEYRINPIGIDTTRPRLSWILESSERGQTQTAYQILAATAPEKLSSGKGDLWDTGKVPSSQSVHVIYAGKPLGSSQRVY